MFGLRCALSLLLMSVFVCQSAQKDEEIRLHTSERLVTEKTTVNIAKQDIQVFKPVVMSGNPYALYRCKTYVHNAYQEEFKAFRLDGLSDESKPLVKDVGPEDFVGVDKILGIIHKTKEQYALFKEGSMVLFARCVTRVAKSCTPHYKAGFFGEDKFRDKNAQVTFEFIRHMYNARAVQSSTRQEEKL